MKQLQSIDCCYNLNNNWLNHRTTALTVRTNDCAVVVLPIVYIWDGLNDLPAVLTYHHIVQVSLWEPVLWTHSLSHNTLVVAQWVILSQSPWGMSCSPKVYPQHLENKIHEAPWGLPCLIIVFKKRQEYFFTVTKNEIFIIFYMIDIKFIKSLPFDQCKQF